MFGDHEGFQFLKTVSSSSNPFYLVRGGDKAKPSTVGGDIQKALTNLPGLPWAKYSKEKHMPGHQFTGANTNLEKRLNPDDTPKPDSIPVNRVDWAAYRHDLAYRDNKDIESRHAADKKMIQELDAIENPSFKERI